MPLKTDTEILEIRSLRRRKRGRPSWVDKDISIKCIVHIFIGLIFTGHWKINKHFWIIIKNKNEHYFLFVIYPLLQAIPSDSELQWEKIGKVVNQAKLAFPSNSELLQSEKIAKVVKWVKLAILSDSESLQWEKIGKVAFGAKLAVTSQSEPLL